jgi:hypothetical protein
LNCKFNNSLELLDEDNLYRDFDLIKDRVNKEPTNHIIPQEFENKNIGSFFNIQIKNASLNITSLGNIFRGAKLTTKGGVFCIITEYTDV